MTVQRLIDALQNLTDEQKQMPVVFQDYQEFEIWDVLGIASEADEDDIEHAGTYEPFVIIR